MSILLDVIVISLLFIFIFYGVKYGLIKSIIGFLGWVIALVLSIYLSNIVSVLIFDNFIRNELIKQINDALSRTVSADLNQQSEAVFNNLPFYLSNTLTFFGVTSSNIKSAISNTTNDAANSIVLVISPVIINIIKAVCMSVIFTIIMIPVGLIVKTIKRVSNIPVIKQVDQILGGVIGMLKCFILIIIITFLMRMFLPTLSNIPEILSDKVINNTFLFKVFYNENPIYNFLIKGLTEKIQFMGF